MPVVTNELYTLVHTSATSLDQSVWDALRLNPRAANIMSAHLLKTLAREQAGEGSIPGQLWIICGTNRPHRSLDLVLSCTQGPIGAYPIFICSPHHSGQLDAEFLRPRLERLIDALHNVVPVQRVFSIFAPNLITNIFVDLWSETAQVDPYGVPYYAADLTYVTAAMLINRPLTVHPEYSYELRLAVEDDILQVAPLCLGFSQKSEPFVLTSEESVREATLLVHSEQLWVHQINRPGWPSEIASIVAVTRDSGPVAAITKVYTNPNWRRLGCAERLVRHVCKHLLASKESIVLFVAHDNPSAKGVYERVGFSPEDVDSWLEIGFDRDMVDLGYW